VKVILDSAFRNWILGAVVKESSIYANEKVEMVFVGTSRTRNPFGFIYRRYFNKLRLSKNDLIVNQKTLLYLVNSKMLSYKFLPYLRCHYTHDTEEFLVTSGLIVMMKCLKEILVLNVADANLLVKLGIDRSSITIIYGAIDREIFHPSTTFESNREVFISGDAKGRKNPPKVIQLINSNPDMKFVICGRYWKELIESGKIKFDNVVFHEFSLELTAVLVRRASAYLTLSFQEGGPFPVLEALASGTPVVSTPVGWVPELINSGNGVLVGHDSSLEEIRSALEKCFKLKETTWQIDLIKGKFSWKDLAMKMYSSSVEGNEPS
jgi:glycosyltransferase involved in cell wall biosynthesis